MARVVHLCLLNKIKQEKDPLMTLTSGYYTELRTMNFHKRPIVNAYPSSLNFQTSKVIHIPSRHFLKVLQTFSHTVSYKTF